MILWLSLFIGTVLAHDAGGWNYPVECCGLSHCRPVDCDELREIGYGSWAYRHWRFPPYTVRPSQDKSCHVCITDRPMCLFIQQGS